MRKKIITLVLLLPIISCCYTGDHESGLEYKSSYEAIQMTREQLKSSIHIFEKREVVNPGKIYIKDDFIFINERNEGFHMYDNSDPSNPILVKFLKVPGATDIAVRNHVFYINQATDLVTLKFNDLDDTVIETGREIKVFSPKDHYPDGGFVTAEEGKIITNFLKIEE